MIKTGESGPNIIGPDPQGRQSSDPNLIVHQINAKLPFEIGKKNALKIMHILLIALNTSYIRGKILDQFMESKATYIC